MSILSTVKGLQRLTEFENRSHVGVVKVKGFLILYRFHSDNEAYNTTQTQLQKTTQGPFGWSVQTTDINWVYFFILSRLCRQKLFKSLDYKFYHKSLYHFIHFFLPACGIRRTASLTLRALFTFLKKTTIYILIMYKSVTVMPLQEFASDSH